VADAELGKIFVQTKYLHQPQNQNNDDDAVQNSFDLTLHRNEPVHKPEQDADYADRDHNGDEGHWKISNREMRADANLQPSLIGTASLGNVRCARMLSAFARVLDSGDAGGQQERRAEGPASLRGHEKDERSIVFETIIARTILAKPIVADRQSGF